MQFYVMPPSGTQERDDASARSKGSVFSYLNYTFHAVRSAALDRPAGGAASSAQDSQHQDRASGSCEALQLIKLTAGIQGLKSVWHLVVSKLTLQAHMSETRVTWDG